MVPRPRLRRRAVTVTVLLALALLPWEGTAAAEVRSPPVGVAVDYQLGGAAEPDPRVGIVVRDRRVAPAAGRYNVCYVNAFQAQPDERSFWARRPSLLLARDGRPVVDEAWGEVLLDIRTAAKRRRIARIVERWTRGCAAAGYDAVELDNLDSFARSRGLISRADAVRAARLFVRAAHRSGLAVAQKNWAGFDGRRRAGFDFAIAEECGRYDECGSYEAVYGRRVLVVEYRRRDFDRACAAWGGRLPIVLRDRDLTPDGVRAWC